MSKAQIAITDAIIAISIFIILIISIILIWNNYALRLDEKTNLNRMQNKAFQITDNLVKTSGIPTAWERNSTITKHIGLAIKDRVLSPEKINAFINLTYNKTRKLFNIEYDFYFRLKDLNNNTLKESGLNPKNNIINLERQVLYENKEAIMQFALWK